MQNSQIHSANYLKFQKKNVTKIKKSKIIR